MGRTRRPGYSAGRGRTGSRRSWQAIWIDRAYEPRAAVGNRGRSAREDGVGEPGAGAASKLNVAVTFVSALIVTWHVPVPEQPPPVHAAKVDPARRRRERDRLFAVYAFEHCDGQRARGPFGYRPAPVPLSETMRVCSQGFARTRNVIGTGDVKARTVRGDGESWTTEADAVLVSLALAAPSYLLDAAVGHASCVKEPSALRANSATVEQPPVESHGPDGAAA